MSSSAIHVGKILIVATGHIVLEYELAKMCQDIVISNMSTIIRYSRRKVTA